MLQKRIEPSDYCAVTPVADYRLSRFERLTLTGGEELDKALAVFGRHFAGFAFPEKVGAIDLKTITAAKKFYSQNSFSLDPKSFFNLEKNRAVISTTLVHGLEDGSVSDLEFDSTYQIQFSEAAKEFNLHPENKRVYARHWKHGDKPRPTIIALHGWTMGDQRVNSMVFLPGLFYRLGMDLVVVELPFHGRRKPTDESAGLLFPSADLGRTNEAVGQVISDLRQIKAYLEASGVKEIGAVGMSLGAYLAALWASLDQLAFCIPIVPLVSMADLAWNVLQKKPEFQSLVTEGLELESLEKIYRLHCPLTYQPQVSKENMLIIAGIGDQIVPARQPKMLWEHWGRPQIQWYQGGHVAQFKKSKAFKEIVRFFEKRGFADRRL